MRHISNFLDKYSKDLVTVDSRLYDLVKNVHDTFSRDTAGSTLAKDNIHAVDELVAFIKENF